MPTTVTSIDNRSHLSITYWRSILSEAAICARERYLLSKVHSDVPVLILPLQGNKRVIYNSKSYSATVGEYMMLHHTLDVSMENIPASDGPYVAGILNFPWRLIHLAQQIVLDEYGLAEKTIDKSSISCNGITE